MASSKLISVKQAAARLAVSCPAVYKALKVGRLPFQLVGGRRMLRSEGLEQRWHGSSQRMVVILVAPEPQGPNWPALAAKVNNYVGPDWPAPPWSPEQINTLAMILTLAGD